MLTITLLIAAHVCSMLGFSTFAALLPQVRDEWGLNNTQAGVVGGMFFAGYIAAVWHWTAATDRADGRKVYAAGSAVAAMGSLGFGLLARGFWSGLLFQAVLGFGIAGTYMPGLRLLSDRVVGPRQSRSIAFYTASFGIGAALSLALAGVVSRLAGWRSAFLASGAGPLVAGALVIGLLSPSAAPERASTSGLRPFATWAALLRLRDVAGYILGYVVHCLELFGSRSWIVAFLTASAGLHAAGERLPWTPQSVAAFANLMSVASSIVGNEVALRLGRRRWILISMAGSGAGGLMLAVSARWPWALMLAVLVVYSMMVQADSATLTAGLVAAAPADRRGAAMGLYSLAGFGGALFGPVVFGVALDAAGGTANPNGWVVGYAAIGSGCLLAPAAVWLSRWAGRWREKVTPRQPI